MWLTVLTFPSPLVDILNNMKEFVFGYNKKLADIREVLSETISEAWNSENDVLQMSLVRECVFAYLSILLSTSVYIHDVYASRFSYHLLTGLFLLRNPMTTPISSAPSTLKISP